MRNLMVLGTFLLPLVFSTSCLAEDDVDKLSAPDLLKKSIAALAAKTGYHFDVIADVPGMNLKGSGTFLSPDAWWAKQEQMELYSKGKKVVAGQTQGGTWKEEPALDKNLAVQVLQEANPQAVLQTMLKYARGAKSLPDDTLDHKGERVVVTRDGGADAGVGIAAKSPWKVIEVEAPAEEAERLLSIFVRVWPGGARLPKFDPAKTGVTYRAWIGRTDLLPCVVEAKYHVTPKNPNDFVPLGTLDLRVNLSDHGHDIHIDAPDEVKKKLGMK